MYCETSDQEVNKEFCPKRIVRLFRDKCVIVQCDQSMSHKHDAAEYIRGNYNIQTMDEEVAPSDPEYMIFLNKRLEEGHLRYVESIKNYFDARKSEMRHVILQLTLLFSELENEVSQSTEKLLEDPFPTNV